MMQDIKAIIVIPIVLAAVAGLGLAIAHYSGWNPNVREMFVSLLAGLLSAEAAVVTIRSLRGHDQAAATQAGLSGMTVLMMVMAGLLLAARYIGIVSNPDALTYWAPAFFMATLACVSIYAIGVIKQVSASRPTGSDRTIRNS